MGTTAQSEMAIETDDFWIVLTHIAMIRDRVLYHKRYVIYMIVLRSKNYVWLKIRHTKKQRQTKKNDYR